MSDVGSKQEKLHDVNKELDTDTNDKNVTQMESQKKEDPGNQTTNQSSSDVDTTVVQAALCAQLQSQKASRRALKGHFTRKVNELKGEQDPKLLQQRLDAVKSAYDQIVKTQATINELLVGQDIEISEQAEYM